MLKVYVKEKLIRFIEAHLDETIFIDRIIQLGRLTCIFISNDLEEYRNGKFKRFNLIWAILFKISTILMLIRFVLSSLVNKKWMTVMMTDPNYKYGNQRYFSFMLSIMVLMILLFGLVFTIQEYNRSLELFIFYDKLKQSRLPRLNNQHKKKYLVLMNVLTKYYMWPTFLILQTSNTILTTVVAVNAYLDPESGYRLPNAIFWHIMQLMFCVQCFSLATIGMIVGTSTTIYLRYKFIEVHMRIRSSALLNNPHQMWLGIIEHNTMSKLTNNLNKFAQYFIFIIYYIVPAPFMLILYLMHATDTEFLARVMVLICFIGTGLIAFIVNWYSSMITKWAHKPYPFVCSYLGRNKVACWLSSQNFRVCRETERT